MSELRNCPHCSALVFDGARKPHACPPKWEAVCDEYDSEHVVEVFALDAQSAVEAWAKKHDEDSAEYSIANGSGDVSHVVRVRRVKPVPRKGGANWEHFVVTGEWEASYWAEPVKGGP